MTTAVVSELDTAYGKLTQVQKEDVKREWEHGELTISGIACKLGITRSFVHSYVRFLSSGGK